MKNKQFIGLMAAGLGAGAVNGLFGAGGGMVLVPLLTLVAGLDEQEVFHSSVAVILPLCAVSVAAAAMEGSLPWLLSLPYLAGSAMGGLAAGLWGQKIPVKWLHKALGLLIIWGGVRFLW